MLRNIRYLAGLALMGPAIAQAGTCEETFTKAGSPVSGLRFIATISVADMTPASAVGQLQGILIGKNYDVLAAEPGEGTMLVEQPMSGKVRAFPIHVTAVQQNGVGTVRMEARLRAAMFVKQADAMKEMCAVLNELRGGRAGLAAAARGKNAVGGGGAPVAVNALEFSHMISKDTERNAAAIPLRYKGKRFTIVGNVAYVTRDGETFRVGFKIPEPWEEAIRLPGTAPFKTDIACLMAAGQAPYALTLKPNKGVRLTGTWHDFDEYRHVVWLKDCRPEK